MDLICKSRGVVLNDISELTACGEALVLPRLKLYDMLEVIDTLSSEVTYLPIDEANAQARGLGTMVAFWERLRNVCPKVVTYNGPILTREGESCKTADDLDKAMLATRHFWFEEPINDDPYWGPVLEAYRNAPCWPPFPPPDRAVLLGTLLHTKDSSPGPDGIPYAAWRVLPDAAVLAMDSYLCDILGETALPPVQIGVWIPKAKLGPTADFFRPLGMPNTIDRLVDGAIASHAMRHTSHLMHPSRTVMSFFKEPQRAVSAVQHILDSDTAASAILIDLSKAFERVNPYWILRLLQIKRAPHWIVAYAKFVLFGRRVMHKVQGRLLPSRAILQGVDMGRSFSVYLFCLAMDPVFHYLNLIPGVISVQGYVDDTTIVGSTEDASWVRKVSTCYCRLKSAGFEVDGRSCYRSCLNSHMKYGARVVTGDELLQYWPQVDHSCGYPTVTAALEHTAVRGYSVLVCRLLGPTGQDGGIMVNLSFQQVLEVCQGRDYLPVAPLFAQTCTCKSKCSVVTNRALRTHAMSELEKAQYGAHSVVSQAPALGLVLFSRWFIAEDGRWKRFIEPTDLSSFHSRSFGKFSDRLRLFSRPQISIQARCTAFNTFVHSVMLYAISYFGITTRDLNYLRQAAVRMVLKRHWLDAEILPHVLGYMGVATLTDPALAATIAALRLFLRQKGDPKDLWTEGSHCRQTVATRVLLKLWADYLPLEHLRAAIYHGQGDPRRTVCCVKKAISRRMQAAARIVLLNKTCTEGWIGGISHRWLDGLSKVPKKWCNGIARFSVLRWALNQDDDHWLANRGTRHQFPCARCGSRADCFPWGFYAAPMCDPCVVGLDLTALTLSPFSQDLFTCQVVAQQERANDGTNEVPTVDPSQPESLSRNDLPRGLSPMELERLTQELDERLPDNNLVCIACGCGDCTVGHWVRWCIIPIVVAHRLLGLQRYSGTLDALSRLSQRALTVCSLVVFHFRRLLRQEGAFFHQTRGERHSPIWWCRRVCQEVTINAHVQLQLRFEVHRKCESGCTSNEDGLILERTLPVHLSTFLRPAVVAQASETFSPGDTVAKLRLSSIALAALQATVGEVQGSQANVKTTLYLCRCGEYHVCVEACLAIARHDILTLHTAQPPVMFAQFDGSAYSHPGVGGAGAALFSVSIRGLELVDWCSYALPRCADNVVAEAYGALAALQLYQGWIAKRDEAGEEPLSLHAIQGDIKPLLQHLQLTGRLRRADLISTIDDFHQAHSLIAPACQLLYRPREANFIADFLAGRGSRFLLDLQQKGQRLPDRPVRIDASPPLPLLLKQQAMLCGTHRAGKTVMCLVERIACTVSNLREYARHADDKIAKGAAHLLMATRSGAGPLAVEYVASAEDGCGRLYARQFAGQYVPRSLRLAVYGRGHKEVDMIGAHYEIIRRSIEGCTLPPILQLRALLRAEWNRHDEQEREEAFKKWPIYVINGGVGTAAGLLQSRQFMVSPTVLQLAYELEAARDAFTSTMMSKYRARLVSTFSNRAFYAIEHIECLAMQTFLRQLQMRNTVCSVIWLHDGVWIPQDISDSDILFAERATLQDLALTIDDTRFFRVRTLEGLAKRAQECLRGASRRDTPPPGRSTRCPELTRDHPHAVIQTTRASHVNDGDYLDRMGKRQRVT